MASRSKKPLTILVDTREQRPLDFSPFLPDVVTEEAGEDFKWPGDYTVKGWEKSIAFERKSVSDLIGTMKEGYVGKDSIRRYESRFDLELEEFERHFDRAFIIIEPDDMSVIREVWSIRGDRPEWWQGEQIDAGTQIARGWYRSSIPPGTIWHFIRALTVDYGCHVYLASSREDAANEIVEIAKRYVKCRRHVIHRGKIAREEKRREAEAPRQEAESPF